MTSPHLDQLAKTQARTINVCRQSTVSCDTKLHISVSKHFTLPCFLRSKIDVRRRNSTTSSDSHIIHNSPRCRAHHSICDCADQEDVLQSWILLFTDTLLHSGSFVCIMRSGSTIEHRRCVMTIEYSSTLSSNVSKLYHRMIQKHIIPVGNLGHHGSIITGQIDDSSFVQDLLRRAGRPAFYDIMSNGPNVLKMVRSFKDSMKQPTN
uniref:Uncharacterized protein n=1 Tax=Gibberella zeae TaxID=5518 RepID=A0A4E9EMQ0_GIBZA